ncbi:hypothetical protein ACSI5I_001562 [Vibrio vulnificus]
MAKPNYYSKQGQRDLILAVYQCMLNLRSKREQYPEYQPSDKELRNIPLWLAWSHVREQIERELEEYFEWVDCGWW